MKKTLNTIVSAFAAFADLYSGSQRMVKPAQQISTENKSHK
ncbi:MAG: hypothetical protein ACRBF0_21640 [Calditrichia bacterium]